MRIHVNKLSPMMRAANAFVLVFTVLDLIRNTVGPHSDFDDMRWFMIIFVFVPLLLVILFGFLLRFERTAKPEAIAVQTDK